MKRLALIAVPVAALLLAAALLVGGAAAVRTAGARITHLRIQSRFVHARMALTIVTPSRGGAGRPLLVFLHGRGADQNSELSDQLFAAVRRLGSRAPDIVFPFGGDHSYWHDRADGRWTEYVLDEVIPAALRVTHADRRRIAIGGISMGGFGAYDIARRAPGRFCAVGGHSAALWRSAGESAPGAFDNAADFNAHDLIRWVGSHRGPPFGRARLWLDGGEQDPFHSADETLARELGIHMHVWPGGHDSHYWNSHMGDYLGFYARALAACG